MTINEQFYRKELAKVAKLGETNRSLHEKAQENRKQATIAYWRLLRQSLVDLPVLERGVTYTAAQKRDFETLRNLFGVAESTFKNYRKAANKIQTSTELQRSMSQIGVVGWSTLATRLILSENANKLRLAGTIAFPRVAAQRLLDAGCPPEQIRFIVADYFKFPEIQDDLVQLYKEKFA